MTKQHAKQARFEAEYSALFDYMYRYVSFRIPHRPDAEDVVSHIFMTAYEKLDQWDEQRGSLGQWLTGIGRFKVIDYWRSKKVVVGLDDMTEISLLDRSLLETSSDRDDQFDAQHVFDMVMDELPAEMRALFALRYIDGLTYAEIAAATDRKPASVRKIFSLLHQRLRQDYHALDPNSLA